MPNSPAFRASCAISAALTRAFVGIHPRVIQVPPTAPLSNNATRLPRRRAARTPAQPPMPAPITATSNRDDLPRLVNAPIAFNDRSIVLASVAVARIVAHVPDVVQGDPSRS